MVGSGSIFMVEPTELPGGLGGGETTRSQGRLRGFRLNNTKDDLVSWEGSSWEGKIGEIGSNVL